MIDDHARLRRLADGRVELTLKRPMHDGTRAIALTPGQLMRRLAAVVPPPKAHGTRYFGAFAPASKVRARLVKPGKGRGKGCLGDPPELPADLGDGGAEDARISWELGRELERSASVEGPADPERPRFLRQGQTSRLFRHPPEYPWPCAAPIAAHSPRLAVLAEA